MKRPLPVPVQGTNLTDKDGKPTSHNYRWMESVGSSVLDTQDSVTSLETSVTNLNAKFANATGSAPLYYCRAWVNFNGQGTTGQNQTIRASGNVSSVFKNGLGDYTINFTTPMPDANYSMVGFSSNNDDNANESYVISRQASGTYTSSSCRITNTENSGSGTGRGDSNIINVIFFR